MCQVLSRDDGAPLGCVLRPPNGGEATYAYTITGALRRLGRARATTQPGVRSSARSAPRRARRGRRTPGVGPLFDLTPLGFRPDLARRRPEAPGGPARATISWEFECLLSMFSGIIAPCRWLSWRHGTWASSQAVDAIAALRAGTSANASSRRNSALRYAHEEGCRVFTVGFRYRASNVTCFKLCRISHRSER
jgi:hypothetical protein